MDTEDVLIRIKCVNDKNGNPRRGWLVIEEYITWFCDEGYEGKKALPFSMQTLTPKATIEVRPSQFRNLKKGMLDV